MKKVTHITLGLLFLLTSCEKKPEISLEGQPIYLSAVLPTASQTKVPYEASAPTTSDPLDVAVWASTTENVFKNDGKNGSEADDHIVAIHTEGHFQSGEPQLLAKAVYPPPREGAQGSYTADPVYFVAMHPQNAWETTDGTKATYTFKGCEDVMFAPQVSGAYDLQDQSQIVTSTPQLEFEHLLTRFTVKMGIELETGEDLLDVIDAWGDITELKIQSYNSAGYMENLNKVSVDLSKGDGFSYDNDVTFTGMRDASMDFYILGTDETFPKNSRYQLTDQIDSVAYVMCAPVTATTAGHEYVITVTTENRGPQELMLDLEKTGVSDAGTGSTRGNHYVVTLKFKRGRTIATVANVTEWKNGGYGTGNIED